MTDLVGTTETMISPNFKKETEFQKTKSWEEGLGEVVFSGSHVKTYELIKEMPLRLFLQVIGCSRHNSEIFESRNETIPVSDISVEGKF